MLVHIPRSSENEQQQRNQPMSWQRETDITTTSPSVRRRQLGQQPFHSRMIVTAYMLLLCSVPSYVVVAFITPTKTMTIPLRRADVLSYQNEVVRSETMMIPVQPPITNVLQQGRPFTYRYNTKAASGIAVTMHSTSRLWLGKKNLNEDGSNIDVDGMETAPFLFSFILLLCIWNFTIPTEFRRARICSAQQVIDYPNSNCKTWSQYVSGIQNYYSNGGTLFKFDFSIDKENNIWITGPQEIME